MFKKKGMKSQTKFDCKVTPVIISRYMQDVVRMFTMVKENKVRTLKDNWNLAHDLEIYTFIYQTCMENIKLIEPE